MEIMGHQYGANGFISRELIDLICMEIVFHQYRENRFVSMKLMVSYLCELMVSSVWNSVSSILGW